MPAVSYCLGITARWSVGVLGVRAATALLRGSSSQLLRSPILTPQLTRVRAGKYDRPIPEVEAARVQRVDQAELLDRRERRPMTELGSAEPNRMVEVDPAISAISTAGDEPMTPGFR